MMHKNLLFITLLLFIIAGCERNREPRRVREINDSLAVAENRPRPPQSKPVVDSTAAKNDTLVKDSLLLSNISKIKDLSVLANTIKLNGVDTIIDKEKNFYTIFAPLNSAFDLLPPRTMNDLKQPDGKNRLRALLTYHIVPGNIKSDSLKSGKSFKTIQGERLDVRVQDSTIYILDGHGSQAAIMTKDIASKNGTIHTLKSVLMPKK